jgi:hypothetical protein
MFARRSTACAGRQRQASKAEESRFDRGGAIHLEFIPRGLGLAPDE